MYKIVKVGNNNVELLTERQDLVDEKTKSSFCVYNKKESYGIDGVNKEIQKINDEITRLQDTKKEIEDLNAKRSILLEVKAELEK